MNQTKKHGIVIYDDDDVMSTRRPAAAAPTGVVAVPAPCKCDGAKPDLVVTHLGKTSVIPGPPTVLMPVRPKGGRHDTLILESRISLAFHEAQDPPGRVPEGSHDLLTTGVELYKIDESKPLRRNHMAVSDNEILNTGTVDKLITGWSTSWALRDLAPPKILKGPPGSSSQPDDACDDDDYDDFAAENPNLFSPDAESGVNVRMNTGLTSPRFRPAVTCTKSSSAPESGHDFKFVSVERENTCFQDPKTGNTSLCFRSFENLVISCTLPDSTQNYALTGRRRGF